MQMSDGRSVVPWERAIAGPPTTNTSIDFSGSLPQWVPPHYSEAQHRAPRSIGHRSTKSQSGSDGLGIESPRHRPMSLAASGRSQSQHRGRRHTTHSFGDDPMVIDTIETPTNGSSFGRRAVRMNSDTAGMPRTRNFIAAGDVWTAALPSRDGTCFASRALMPFFNRMIEWCY